MKKNGQFGAKTHGQLPAKISDQFERNFHYEAYYTWRRTGIPNFSQGGVGIGTPNNLIPLRWQYPQDEITYNPANYNTSIAAQYGGKDDVNAKMWLIK